MSKKTLKIATILIMSFFMISFVVGNVFATDITPGSIDGNSTTGGIKNGVTEIQNVGNAVVGILRTVGIILSVIVLIIIGIKYMMGSAEEKADYKKTMIPYLVGAVLIFAASVFAETIYQFITSISTGT